MNRNIEMQKEILLNEVGKFAEKVYPAYKDDHKSNSDHAHIRSMLIKLINDIDDSVSEVSVSGLGIRWFDGNLEMFYETRPDFE